MAQTPCKGCGHQAAPGKVRPALRALVTGAQPSPALPPPPGKSSGFFSLFSCFKFSIYSFAPLPVCSSGSEGEDVWRRDGSLQGSCQPQLDRTGPARCRPPAGIPGVLSNVPPPPPANTRVSPEGEEQEPEPVLERRAQHPAPLGRPCRGNLRTRKSPEKTRSDQNASARRRPCTARPCSESGGTAGALSGHTNGGKNR